MAKKRHRKRGSKIKGSSGLSDGVKKSIFAIGLCALSLFFLLGFFDLAGSLGQGVDGWLAYIFGWNRWIFAFLLFAVGIQLLLPQSRLIGPARAIGFLLFFLSFNGLLNLILFDAESGIGLAQIGGFIGLIISNTLFGILGFWGSFLVAFSVLFISVLLVFDLSLEHVMTLPKHLSELRSLMKRTSDQRPDEMIDTDEPSDVEREESDEEQEQEVSAVHEPHFDHEEESSEEIESVMTSRKRRKVEIPLELLQESGRDGKSGDIDRNQEMIRKTFENFGIDVEMSDVRVGPTVTQYALRPAQGIKLSRIIALHNDLALALAAHPIRIEAPIPGRSLVGIEVPNQKIGMVCLRELLNSKEFKIRNSNFFAPLGRDVGGVVNMVAVDKTPHMLVAGATGSGKSVCLNDIILSLLYQNGPDDLKFIMVDPKRVELNIYAGIPHLLVPPITKVEEAINALKWAVREMERRLDYLAKSGTRDIDAYNKKFKDRMPKIVIIIDELADLMSQSKRDVEAVIVRIAQMARAVGIHLILATQRPSVDVITGLIKANIPTRIAFAVASQVDSKTILDQAGAEKLLGRGDMLLTSPQISKPKRIQGAYVSEQEIERVVQFLKEQGEPDYNYQVTEDLRTGGSHFSAEESDPMLDEAIEIVVDSGKASTSFLQRRIKIGYSRAARMIDIMEDMGVVGPANGSKPREVLVDSWPLDVHKPSNIMSQKNQEDDEQCNDLEEDEYDEVLDMEDFDAQEEEQDDELDNRFEQEDEEESQDDQDEQEQDEYARA